MKKLLLSLIALVSCLSLFTQDALLIYRHNYPKPLFVALKDVSTISHSDTAQVLSLEEWNIQAQSLASDIDSIVFIESDTINSSDYAYFTCPDDHHPHMIDLGLPSGTLWSCCNVDATNPEEYGGYYAWGDTEEKAIYNSDSYTYYNDNRFVHIGDDIAGTEYDVAHVKWGGPWRMPTEEQVVELVNKCKWEYKTPQNDLSGTLVTGPNGAKIFLPWSGYYSFNSFYSEGEYGLYWSSSLNQIDECLAVGFNVVRNIYITNREMRHNIRPVVNPDKQSLCPDENHPHMIDLGLPSGTLWSCCNINATKPNEYGGYYAWGETEEKEYYDWSTYIHCDGKGSSCHHIGDDIAGTEYDVAHVKWAGPWRMPSYDQMDELFNNSTLTWTSQEGINGYLVTGPNGSSIFLPASDNIMKDNKNVGGTGGWYWSSCLYQDEERRASLLSFGSSGWYWDNEGHRYIGNSVRPIVNQNDYCPLPEAVDLGLPSGTKWASWNVGASTPEEAGGYYAWGETEERDCYNVGTYKYYNSETKEYIHIGNDIAGTEYDVAHVKWGGSWCMPSIDQFKELIDKCSRIWTSQNGVNGILVTGPNGNTIFLPAAGDHAGDNLSWVGSFGCYWSSSNYRIEYGYAYSQCFDSNNWFMDSSWFQREFGQSVRAVYTSKTTPDLHVSHKSINFTVGNSATIKIFSGSGNYEISNFNTSVVEATLDGTTITLKGLSEGKAVVKVIDLSSGQKANIDVTVSASFSDCPVADAIDLGLSSGTKWASWNVGASKPEEYGDYYAWGETEEKDRYDWSSYIHCDGTGETYHNIGDDISGTEYDVAHVKWGGSWRMPSRIQIMELINQCTYKWTTQNGVKGQLVTGPNGNTIFLPAAGYHWSDGFYYDGLMGYYWSSSLYMHSESCVYTLNVSSSSTNWLYYSNCSRRNGFSVRPVCP